MRLGYVPFPISTRNSAQAAAHLMRVTECHHLFVSKDAAMQDLSKAAKETLGSDYAVETYRMPGFEELYGGVENDPLPEPVEHPDMNGIALILHSSGKRRDICGQAGDLTMSCLGSTAFPKVCRLEKLLSYPSHNHGSQSDWHTTF